MEVRAPAEQTEGTRSQVLRWLKSIGDEVVENEPLIEIETDKVTVEVAAPVSGTLREITKQEQEEIAPGDLLGRIEASAAGATDARVESSAGVSAEFDAAASAEATAPGVNARAGGTQAVMAPGVVARAAGDVPGEDGAGAANATSEAVWPDTTPLPSVGDSGTTAYGPNGSPSRPLSPAVRRLLSERGLQPSEVRGTGQGGRITVADVLDHTAGRPTASGMGGAPGTAGPSGAAAVSTAVGPGPSRRVPHTPTRRRIAEHMVQSLLHTAPHVTTVFEADLTAVLEHREKYKDEFARRNVQLTLTAYFLQAAVAAIRAVPEANSRWTEDALEVFDSVHIGVATALDTGLVVPVLRDVQSRDLFETARGLEDLVSRAREGRLSPADVRGGTFTISNHGVSGSLVATPIIINQPQAAILGVGKLEKRPIVVSEGGEDRLVIRPQCYVTLTIDHRVMDGHQANRFLQTFVKWLVTSHGSY